MRLLSANALLRAITRDKFALAGCLYLALCLVAAIFAPLIAPYDPSELIVDPDTGLIDKLQPPSPDHLLGTTTLGQDILSQVIFGARAALIVGFVSAFSAVFIGANVGLLAGYRRGATDSFLMRAVDVAYSIPSEVAALVFVAVFGPSVWTIIVAVSLLMWRSTARVVRAQVLSYAQRPFVKAARCAGASGRRIIYRHIAPNVVGVSLVYLPIAFGWAIFAQATLGFLGFGDPETISWGQILQLAFANGAMRVAWWWTVPPGLAIMLLISATFFLNRALEEVVNPQLQGIEA
jgi:peptide/nickel transport system permease protein